MRPRAHVDNKAEPFGRVDSVCCGGSDGRVGAAVDEGALSEWSGELEDHITPGSDQRAGLRLSWVLARNRC